MTSQEVLFTTPALDQFFQLAESYNVIPVIRTLNIFPDPLDLYRKLRSDKPGFILESAKGGLYSYVGFGSMDELIVKGDAGRNPLTALREFLARPRFYSHPDLENFPGGPVGFFSYDLVRSIERLPAIAADRLSLPLIHLVVPEYFVEVNHQTFSCRIVVMAQLTGGAVDQVYSTANKLLDQVEEKVRHVVAQQGRGKDYPDVATEPEVEQSAKAGNRVASTTVEAHTTEAEFAEKVTRAIEYIYAGDIFQVNLSVRFSDHFQNETLELYQVLRKINPAPYMAFLDFHDYAVVSSSPELLLKLQRGELSTRPIAGTRKRGKDEVEDREKVEELIGNEKERAEHLMLVDLERNDLGRVCQYGTVQVDEFMSIEKYSHVIHIVSNVRGRLAEGKDVIDAIASLFPGGTITGAPKVRSMEIIEELEPERRDIYTGSIGWLGYNGDAELNIAIRTILLKDGRAYIQAGAGIVADSVPAFEYKESLRKAEAMFKALRELKGG
ncbi:MAG: anthranilate synthase component I family protein [Candidatus Kapaibacterium sp.]